MEIEGKVIQDLGTLTGTSKAGNPWAKKEVIIETFGPYPKKVKLTIFGEQRMNNTPCEVGNSYAFTIEIERREYMNRWYTDVNAFSSRVLASNTGVPADMNQSQNFATSQTVGLSESFSAGVASAPADPFGSNESDDLPF